MMLDPAPNLLSLNRQGLAAWLAPLGVNMAQAGRVLQSIHQHHLRDFSQLTWVNKAVRYALQQAQLEPLVIKQEQFASDGVIKWLFQLSDDNAIETVFIPSSNRNTLCISSQVGCSLNCSFCATARQGFSRNLNAAEIIGQVYSATHRLMALGGYPDRAIRNVVFMGMGEPLLNFDAVAIAGDVLLDEWGYGLAGRRVTISTAGVVPIMQQLAQRLPTALAVSLHAPTDELRNLLVPLNKKYPLSTLIASCRDYYPHNKQEITFEYAMLAGVNDQQFHAEALIELLTGMSAKVNLIPFNPFPGAEFQTSPAAVIAKFQQHLKRAGLVTTIRTPRGGNIAAACGQLAGEVSSKVKRLSHITHKLRKIPIIPSTSTAVNDTWNER